MAKGHFVVVLCCLSLLLAVIGVHGQSTPQLAQDASMCDEENDPYGCKTRHPSHVHFSAVFGCPPGYSAKATEDPDKLPNRNGNEDSHGTKDPDRAPSMVCERCPEGTYSNYNRTSCKPCGHKQTSPPGSPSKQHCSCIAGFGADETGQCTACPVGSFGGGFSRRRYDDPAGPEPCTPCSKVTPHGKSTTVTEAPSSPHDCICKPGHGGQECISCQPGAYSPGGSELEPRAECRACPKNSIGSRSPGAVDIQDCGGCKPGFGGHDCDLCPANTFSSGGSFKECVPCGPNQVSPPGSTFCQCITGFGATSTGSCDMCPAGTYWPGPQDVYASSEDGYQGYDDEDDSTRSHHSNKGYYDIEEARLQRSYDDPDDHRHWTPSGVQRCIRCDGGSTTLKKGSTTADDCVCIEGFGGHKCSICPPGTFSPGGSSYDPRPECTPCPETFRGSSRPGATGLDECGGCKPGYAGPHCQPCPPDSFSLGDRFSTCTPCGPNQISPPMSPSRNYCQCIKGYGQNATNGCSVCPFGTFWGGPEDWPLPDQVTADYQEYSNEYADVAKSGPPTGIQPCNNCSLAFPTGGSTTLFQGSTSSKDCVCSPGYGGQRCEICQPGTYSPGGEVHDPHPDCRICPQNTIGSDKPGAKDKFECGGCLPGFGGRHCERCPANTFSPGGNYSACQACGANQVSPPGSPSREYCDCLPGFGQINGTTQCELCPKGTFSALPAGTNKPRNKHKDDDDDAEGTAVRLMAANQLVSIQAVRVTQILPCVSCSSINPTGNFTTISPGSDSAADCVCAPGYGSAFCTQCPSGTYSGGGDTKPCKACPGGSSSTSPPGATSPSDCGCAAGTGGQNCEQCPAGTFSGGPKEPCKPCPPGTTSPAGSTSQSSCVACSTAYLDLGPAGPCRVRSSMQSDSCSTPCCNMQGAIASDGACKTCPAGTTTNGTGNATSCDVCAAGFGLEQSSTQCTPCPPGTFSTGGALSPCALCPIGMSSALGAKTADECFCITPGWGIIAGVTDSCRPCPVGYFSAQNRGRRECVSCPTCMTTLRPASGSSTDCVCTAGCGKKDPFSNVAACEKCISPFYQGYLDGNGVPVTGATKSQPYPNCVQCTGTATPSQQVTGSPDKVCTIGSTTLASAYCAVANITAIGEQFSLAAPVKVPACGTATQTREFTFVGSTVQKFTLPKGIVSMRAELAGGAGGPGFRCNGDSCTPATKGGLAGVLSVKNLEVVLKGGEDVYILVGGGAAQPSTAQHSVAGGGGGFSAILSQPDPGSLSTIWYASAGGGGGGAGSVCMSNGVCLGSSGEAGCASGLLDVNFTNSVGQPAPRGGAGGAGFAVEGAAIVQSGAANGQPGSEQGGGYGGGWTDVVPVPGKLEAGGQHAGAGSAAKVSAVKPVSATKAPPKPATGSPVFAYGGGGGGFGATGADSMGGYGGGGAGSVLSSLSTVSPATATPGGGGGGGYWAGAGGANTLASMRPDAELTRVGQGGGGGNCMVASGLSSGAQKIQAEALAGANAGHGYVKLVIVTAL